MGDIVLTEGTNTLNIALTPVALPVASLYGKVTDASTGKVLSSVKVTIAGVVDYTDAYGEYGFEGLTPGSYTIKFEKTGYVTVTK